ncbi:MAG TPA: MFS transporter [Candidatus Paceibacterota bacterium]|nr:MFS transporter [Verrucomicrobiota bacterium]HRY46749.1 MFS transporter [Candidatus Paceibacterota bacterium]
MEPNAHPTRKSSRPSGFWSLFAPAPAIPVTLSDPAEIDEAYRHWRRRVLLTTIVGYALFYFVRKNLSVAMPVMGKDLGITKVDLGLFLTLHGLLYGVARFANGFLADRANARTFMAVGLAASALMNVFFGFSSAVVTLGIVWMLNGWVQGMGFPPVSHLMTHWFPPKELATKQSIWNTSHSIGAGLVVILCGYLVTINWRLCFLVPAALALIGSAFLWRLLPDTPPSVGLPEVEGTEYMASHAENDGDFKRVLMENVFRNKYIWLMALANFFVYVVRYAVLDWGPTLLSEAKGLKLVHASWLVAAFEISGVVGMLLGGWLTDRVFGGRGARACLVYMALATLAVFVFWKLPVHSKVLSGMVLCAAGFFIYGPQALIGIIVANLATKRAAATAAGFTGIFGYASTLLSGWGLGFVVQKYGWDVGFLALVGMGLIGTLLFAAGWKAKAHGYAELTPDRDRVPG